MDSDHLAAVDELFAAAIELPEQERLEFLERQTHLAPAVVAEVRSLLASAPDDDAMDRGIQLEELVVRREAMQHPEQIGPFKIRKLLGEGGMGLVFQADQESPVRRRVALKLIRKGMDTEQVVARFESERQALALMNHPAIAQVYDAGSTEDGRPYFVMEYVPGVPIVGHCDHHRLNTRERLRLLVEVCHGVQHAHQKGIIHRDLKSSNILVATQDGQAIPKIIDFGIAKATEIQLSDKAVHTEAGLLIGTPEYMSPEQAEMGGQDLDTRTDVYSLGVLLYELLVGSLPFRSAELRQSSFDELRRKIREVDPPRPSTRFTSLGAESGEVAKARRIEPAAFTRELRGDLDWITMKALEKDRSRRYSSVSELAADIERFLADEPVLARPPGTIYRLTKFSRRHRVGVAASAVVLLVLVGGIVGTTVGMVRAQKAERGTSLVANYLASVFLKATPEENQGREITVRELLDRESEQIQAVLSEAPATRRQLMYVIGMAYRRIGLYEKARLFLQQVRTETTQPVDSIDVLNELGNIAIKLGEYEEGLPLYQEALVLAEEVYGVDHPEVAALLTNLAEIYENRGDLDQARQALERSLEIRKRAVGPDPEKNIDREKNITLSTVALGELLSKSGDHEAAIPLLEAVLDQRRALYEPNHRRIGYAHYRLADASYKAEHYEKARDHFEQALAIWTTSLKPDHEQVGQCSADLARALHKTGENQRAEELFLRSIEIEKQHFADSQHPEYVAERLGEYAEFLLATGRETDAKAVQERASHYRPLPEPVTDR